MIDALVKEMDVQIKKTQSPVIERLGELGTLITNLDDNDILLIERIETLNTDQVEMFIEVIEKHAITIPVRSKGKEVPVHLPLKQFTIVGTTSRPSQIDRRLRR